MILIIDNYDSFVHNLVQYFGELESEAVVYRNDGIDLATIKSLKPKGIVISPGPCGPDEAGISKELVRYFGDVTPILGVCLGHQVIGAVFGGTILRAKRPVHGKTSTVIHTDAGVLKSLPNPLKVCRYHSLVIDRGSLPSELDVTAYSQEDGEIMAVKHRTLPIEGVQFHPESIYTEAGHRILGSFIRYCS